GLENSLTVSPLAAARLGNHAFGIYAQDNWKVNRKLTIDYGLRWDFATLLSEQYGRMQNAAFNLPNPVVGGRLGTVVYGQNCHCQFNGNYPYAFGPRLGIAYKLDEKTVLRVGGGLSYGTSPNNAFLTYSVPDFYNFVDQPVAGLPAQQLKYGNPFAPGNPFGNPPLTYPDLSQHFPYPSTPGYIVPNSPFISIDRNAGRLPRIAQWSVGIQREVLRGTVLDVTYVGNRGAYWTAPTLSTYAYNTLTPATVAAAGLNPTSASDLALLNLNITSPLVQQRFPNLKIVTAADGSPTVPAVYPGFPATQLLQQALRPYPQFIGIPPFLGPPLGDTWYDGLQVKVTKRYSHGLDVQYNFTYQREFALGVNSDTGYLTPNAPPINDVFNYRQNKEISAFERPLVSVLSLNYTTPRFVADRAGLKALSWIARDWVYGAVLRYQSGQLLTTAKSNNGFFGQLGRGVMPVFNNPAVWGGGNTYQNVVSGQSFFAMDPNCHCFDPTKQLVLNPAAFADAGTGQFGTAAAYYEGYRWQRQPSEAMSFGRIFPLSKEQRVKLQVRVEFQNVFNRVFYNTPSTTNPTSLTFRTNPFPNGQAGALSLGYGFVNSLNGSGAQPRTGQFIARITF
ncbi:MAG: TonB-dependent receptor, partial [Bryobacterales bacterium]|nr:TonB-dependent receptor [Bryobacterales bacterium]